MFKIVNIADIRPADYNPRKITPEQFEELKKSLTELGFCIPILINRANNTIVAGHQRTKAATAIGIKRVPAFFINDLALGDEIKFNQMHNAIDEQYKKPTILNSNKYAIEEFIEINANDFIIGDTISSIVKETCKIIIKYGNVLSAVICDNQVITGNDYIKACKLLGLNVNAYILNKTKLQAVKRYFSLEYGKYFYNDIKRKTFVQGLAQMIRATEKTEDKRQNASALYEKLVLPHLDARHNKAISILDFGCGKGAYIDMLKNSYPNAIGVEFYNNNRKGINIAKGNRQIDELYSHIKNKGMFDVVICDSVLNSVDSVKAENSVLGCLNLFCKDVLFISGRTLESATKHKRMKTDPTLGVKYLQFLDDNNFTANYREGQWYFQHFHSRETATELLNRFGFEIIDMQWGKTNATSFQIMAKKVKNLTAEQYKEAVSFEFDLPLPNDNSYNRHTELLNILKL